MNRAQMERRSFLKTAAALLQLPPSRRWAASLKRSSRRSNPRSPPRRRRTLRRPARTHLCTNPRPRRREASGHSQRARLRRDRRRQDEGHAGDPADHRALLGVWRRRGGGSGGHYLAGALSLRSNVVLRVEEGATLNGSPDMADYPLAQVRWEGHSIKGYSSFINATDAENIGLAGPGKIVGIADRTGPGGAAKRDAFARADRVQQLQERARGRSLRRTSACGRSIRCTAKTSPSRM